MRRVTGATALIFTAMTGGLAAMAYEQPSYRVLEEREDYEIRAHDAYLAAETTTTGDFGESGNAAFRILASYIFGENTASEKMSMTVPVTSWSESSSGTSQRYTYQFVMEREYDAETLPKPNDERVAIREVPARTVAARRYTGRTTESNFRENLEALVAALDRDGVTVTGEPEAAVYNGPFTLPFMRRNEVLLEIAPAE